MWSTYPSLSSSQGQPVDNNSGGAFGDGALDCLDLGHAAQLNDDLLKTLREEIATVDASLRTASGAVQNEERSFAQLSRDCDHARGEMFDRRRGAAEVLDSESMRDDVRVGFKGQFAAEVAVHVVSPDKVPRGREEAAGGAEEDAVEGVGTPSWDHPQTLADHGALKQSKEASLRTKGGEIATAKREIQKTNGEAAGVAADAQAQNLAAKKAEGERRVEAKRREREGEAQRGRGVREAVRAARANSGAHAQKIAEKAKEQMAERGTHVAKEAALASANGTKGQELALLEAEEKKLDAELAALSGQLDFLTRQAAEFAADRTKSDEMKAEAEAAAGEAGALGASKEGKAKEAEASKADLASAVAAFDEATEAAATAGELKLANDKETAEAFEPAAARKGEAVKEKERLAGAVVELQKSIEEATDNSKGVMAASGEKVAAKASEVKAHTERLERARSDLEALQKKGADEREALAKEHQEYKDFATKFEGATTSELDRLDQLKKERVDARLEQIERRRSEVAATKDARVGDVGNMKDLRAIIDERREMKVKMDNKDILFDREGEEIEVDSDIDENEDDLEVEVE